ncbi:MAG: tetratricopeptide repeat protein [Isosphaeraceae bacterium]
MRGAELYDRVVNWPGLSEMVTAYGVAVAFIMIASMLLALGRYRVFARILGILGLLLILGTMFIIHEQTVKERISEYVTVTHYRYPESTRFQIRVALLGLPAAAATVMIFVLGSTRRHLRATVPNHLRQARILSVRGDHDQALSELNKALAIAPYLGEAYFQRGCVQQAKGEVDLALADFDQAIQCDPQLALAYLHRGRIRTEKGELESALADFERVMIMRPNDPDCYLNRGVCLARKGLISDAILDFQRVLKLTNHSDYAEPARHYLDQLGGENPLPESSTAPGVNGSAHTAEPVPGKSAQDYVL